MYNQKKGNNFKNKYTLVKLYVEYNQEEIKGN